MDDSFSQHELRYFNVKPNSKIISQKNYRFDLEDQIDGILKGKNELFLIVITLRFISTEITREKKGSNLCECV